MGEYVIVEAGCNSSVEFHRFGGVCPAELTVPRPRSTEHRKTKCTQKTIQESNQEIHSVLSPKQTNSLVGRSLARGAGFKLRTISNRTTTTHSKKMPRLEEWEIKKYWEIFQGLRPQNNKLNGDKVLPVLKNLRLPEQQLAQIWELSDIDTDGQLDFEEFCIAMRLIFDMVNGSTESVPAELPGWLVPLSKAHLLQANKAVSGKSPQWESDDDDMLSDDFDWYILPTDKGTYETIYNSALDQYGRVTFDSLNGLYQTLSKVPKLDILSAWNLVNPKSAETIDKDQVLVFLHMLNQREHGKRVPRSVPASLRATFSKEVPKYDLSTPQTAPAPRASDKKSFGTSYLNKIGQANNTDRGTDFSATEGTDWEEVRLRRELANLEDLLGKAQQEAKAPQSSELHIVRHEYEQLLKYKKEKLVQAKNAPADKDLSDVRNDIDLIGSQVKTLQEFLRSKEQELAGLKKELLSLS